MEKIAQLISENTGRYHMHEGQGTIVEKGVSARGYTMLHFGFNDELRKLEAKTAIDKHIRENFKEDLESKGLGGTGLTLQAKTTKGRVLLGKLAKLLSIRKR